MVCRVPAQGARLLLSSSSTQGSSAWPDERLDKTSRCYCAGRPPFAQHLQDQRASELYSEIPSQG